MRDNEQNQSKVAYEVGPKEVNTHHGMPRSKQFGKEKMPQDKKPATKGYVKEVMAKHVKTMHKNRHKEHR